MAPEPRTQHPYHMHDAIMAQPQAFADIVGRTRPLSAQSAPRLAQSQRIYLVGIGTSFHAAQVGYHLFRHAGVAVPVQAMHSFDFALYGPELTSRDSVIVISHRGGKHYSVASIKRAREAGCHTLLITGEGSPATMQYADVTFTTTEQDKSSAHTVSYTGTIAVLACLAEALGQRRDVSADFLGVEVPAILRVGLGAEEPIAALAREHAQRRRIWIAGGGPSGITAPEIALKIKETSYTQAEGMPVEVMLHGPFQCIDPSDLFIVIAPGGPAQERTLELAAMVDAIGAPALVVHDGTATGLPSGAAVCQVAVVPEPFTALTCLLPLQLFSYHLALARGTNPDGFRLEDPHFAAAMKLIQL